MKKILLLICISMLSGCAGSSIVTEAGLESVSNLAAVATDRHHIAGEAYKARMLAVQSANNLEIAKLQSKDSVVIKIDSKDEITAYALTKAIEAVSRSSDHIAKALIVLASGGHTDISYMYSDYKAPEGAFAEGIRATGEAIGNVFRTPAAGIIAGGYAIGEVLGGIEQGRSQVYESNGGDINVNHREVSTESVASGSNSSITNTTATTDSCATGECGKGDGKKFWGECTADFLAGIPGCSSCDSYFAGRCSVKP